MKVFFVKAEIFFEKIFIYIHKGVKAEIQDVHSTICTTNGMRYEMLYYNV